MYSLPCPRCEAISDVAPSQAGDQITCPSCGEPLQIPKLGDLRQLPRSSETIDRPAKETAIGRQIAFVVLGLISLATLIIAGFCGIRWALLDAPQTTESSLQAVRDTYSEMDAAQLVLEYEDMEKYGLAIGMPYSFKILRNKKNAWGRNAMIAGLVCAGCGITAFILAASKQSAGADT